MISLLYCFHLTTLLFMRAGPHLFHFAAHFVISSEMPEIAHFCEDCDFLSF